MSLFQSYCWLLVFKTLILGTWNGSLLKECSDPARIVYTHQDYVDLVGSSGEVIMSFYMKSLKSLLTL